MQTYSYNGIVSAAETEALKEMIFNRVRQRAEALAQNTQNQYTSSFKEELMDIARASFNAPNNPFAIKSESQTENKSVQAEKGTEIGFKQKKNEAQIQEIIKQKNENSNLNIAQIERLNLMKAAETDLKNNHQFTGALEFLNAQAGLQMANKKKSSFDTIA